MLPNADAVTDGWPAAALDALHPNATWAQMGTIGVEATELLAADVGRRRAEMWCLVDAPVSGSREPARNGRLILASGPDHPHNDVNTVFGALGQRTVWLGPGRHCQPVEARAQHLARFLRSRPLPRPAHWPSASAFRAPSLWTRSPAAAGVRHRLAKLAKMARGDYSADLSPEWAVKDLDLAPAAAGETTPVAMAIAELARPCRERQRKPGHQRRAARAQLKSGP